MKTKKMLGLAAIVAVIALVVSCSMLSGLGGGNKPCDPDKHQFTKNGSKKYLFDQTHHWETCFKCKAANTSSRAAHSGNPCRVCGYDSRPPSGGGGGYSER